MMDKLKNKKWILLIIFGGLILRLTGVVTTNFSQALDFLRDWKIVSDFVSHGKFIFVGPTASVNPNFHLGPFYYYLLIIPRFFSADYRAAVIWVSLISSTSIYLLYVAAHHWFSEKYSLMLAALYSFSLFFVHVGSFLSNVFVVPAMISFLLFFLVKIREGKHRFLPLYFLFMSFLLQAHATGLFLIPMFLFLLPLNKIKPRIFLLSTFVFLISFSPWIFYNFICGNCEVREGLKVFDVSGANESWHFAEPVFFVLRFFSSTILARESWVLSVLSALFILITLSLKKINEDLRKMILLWLIFPTALFLFYSAQLFSHYFIIFFPMPFFLLIILLQKIEVSFRKRGKFLTNLIFLSVILWNLIQFGRL